MLTLNWATIKLINYYFLIYDAFIDVVAHPLLLLDNFGIYGTRLLVNVDFKDTHFLKNTRSNNKK
jgi:hypothetical protein